jgi:dTDP-4-dehydrorhamnose reductase
MSTYPQLAGRRIAVTGAGGQLGRYLTAALMGSGVHPIGFSHNEGQGNDHQLDITDNQAVLEAFTTAGPDIIIHAAAYTDVDGCERDPDRAQAVNGRGSANVAAAARSVGAYLVMVSTDFVFSGNGGAPYPEHAGPEPLSWYGRSKLAGEDAVLAANPEFAVARTAWLYGGTGKHFPRTVLTVLRDRGSIAVVTDERGSPTFAADLAEAIEGSTSRLTLARAVAQAAGLDPARVEPTTTAAFLAKYPLPARRPADSTLANTRGGEIGIALRPWEEAVAEYVPRLAHELGLRLDSSALTSLEGASTA